MRANMAENSTADLLWFGDHFAVLDNPTNFGNMFLHETPRKSASPGEVNLQNKVKRPWEWLTTRA